MLTFLQRCCLCITSFYCFTALAAPITVTDYTGAVIQLDKPATRIISLAPHITENVFSAGAGDLLVGVMAFSNFPESAKLLPIVGSAQGVNLEKIISLSPDLVLAWHSGLSQSTLTRLKQLSIPVYHDEPRHLEDIAKSIRDIAYLAGREAVAETLVIDYLSELAQMREQYQTRYPVSVLYQIWHEPLMSLNGEHIVTDVMELCGGRNAFADAAVIAPVISIEAVLERDPDTIITSGAGEFSESLRAWERWPELSAVKNQQLFMMPPDILQRHSVRLLKAAKILCEHLENVRQERLK